MSEPKAPEKCVYCGGTDWDDGQLMQRGQIYDIRYKSNNTAVFARKQLVAARICLSCGHISLRITAK